MHKRYAQSLAQYKAKKLREKLFREKITDTAKIQQPFCLPVSDNPLNTPSPEVRECTTFLIYGFAEALERYKKEHPEQFKKKSSADL